MTAYLSSHKSNKFFKSSKKRISQSQNRAHPLKFVISGIKNLENVCYEILEPVRAKFDKPVTVTSGYISEALCEAIGSKKTSQHAKGQAVDFEIAGVPNIQVAYWLQNNVDFDQLILEFYNPDDPAGGWVHVSYNEKGSNRKQVLTYDGKKFENGLPDMKWKDGKVSG